MVPSREFLSAKRGYVCAVIDYRKIQDDPAVRGVLSASPADLSGQAEVIRSTFAPEFPLDQVRRGIEAGFDDTVRAIEWMVESAASLGVDPARIAVGGWSAGSVNSLWAAYVEKAPVAAVWSNSGGMRNPHEFIQSASEPPAVLFHGDADAIASVDGARALVQQLKDAGVPNEYYEMAGEDHFYTLDRSVLPTGETIEELLASFLFQHMELRRRPCAIFSVAMDGSQSRLVRLFDATLSIPALSGDEIVAYRWVFGDGATGEGEMAAHTYEHAGRYRVTLEVVDSAGATGTSTQMVGIECPTADPQELNPWSVEAVGDVLAGVTVTEQGCWSLCGGGDIAIRSPGLFPMFNDHLNYVQQPVEANFTIEARVAALEPRSGAQVGLMVRSSLDTDAQFAAITVAHGDGDYGVVFRARSTPGAEDSRTIMPTSLPAWIRIKRLGDEVVGLASPDGQRWNEIARAMFPLGEGAVHVGVAASGAEPGPETPFVVPEVVVCDLATWGPAFGTEGSSFRRGDCNDDGTVDISDAVFSLGSLFLGDGDPDCDDACDSNGDGEMDISDAINTLGVLFLGQGSIPPPGMTDCGVDPTAEQPGNELGCLQYESCPEG